MGHWSDPVPFLMREVATSAEASAFQASRYFDLGKIQKIKILSLHAINNTTKNNQIIVGYDSGTARINDPRGLEHPLNIDVDTLAQSTIGRGVFWNGPLECLARSICAHFGNPVAGDDVRFKGEYQVWVQ